MQNPDITPYPPETGYNRTNPVNGSMQITSYRLMHAVVLIRGDVDICKLVAFVERGLDLAWIGWLGINDVEGTEAIVEALGDATSGVGALGT
ncbi:unnamed protein product [Euphydryas editha]|uniref:Uncharacterized protein n=1 Tax=Euphydryas editha TaxID=104508 RepID=A0AAU9UXD6_EUPED|nr:unnamed protein product [Euphydryas editha]